MNTRTEECGFLELRELSARDGTRVCVCRRMRDGRTTIVKFLANQPRPDPVWDDTWFRNPPPGIMPIVASGRDADGARWVEMPFADAMEGPETLLDSETYTPANLRLRMAEEAPWALDRVVALARRLAQALRALHDRGWSHRDVKPSNLFFLNGEVVLGDLDLVGPPGHYSKQYGTQGYMPVLGIGDQAGDLFALGRTLYELWTGADRFEFPSLPVELLRTPEWQNRGERFNDLLLRLCPADPRKQKIRTAEGLLEALDGLDRPAGRWWHRRKALVGLAVSGCLLAAFLLRPSADKAPQDHDPLPRTGQANGYRDEALADEFSVRLSLLTRYSPGGLAWKGVAVREAIAYVALGQMGVHLLDVTRPEHPVLVGQYHLKDTRGLDVQGNLACFVTMGATGQMHLVDVTDPAKPTLIGREDSGDRQWSVTMDGDLAYIAGERDFKVVSIASPERPRMLGYYDFPEELTRIGTYVDVAGTNAYLADGPNGVQVFNVVDPRNPVRVWAYVPPGCDVDDVRFRDGLVYVAAKDPGLLIVDFARVDSPVLVGSYSNNFRPQCLAFVGPYAFVGARNLGLAVLNIADPRNPRLIETLKTEDWVRGISLWGNYLFAAEKSQGLSIYRIDFGPGVAPMFTEQPRTQSVAVGATAVLRTAVAGHEPMSFQWRKNGHDLAGETNANLTIARATNADVGTYAVEARNQAGTVWSANAVLSVATRQPGDSGQKGGK